MITPGGNFTVEEGRSTVFTCKIVGGISQQPILWYGLDDRQIKEDYRWVILTKSPYLVDSIAYNATQAEKIEQLWINDRVLYDNYKM